MQRITGYYLYQIGQQIHPLAEFKTVGQVTTFAQARFPLLVARGALEPFLNTSVFKLQTSLQDGDRLHDSIKRVLKKCEEAPDKNASLDLFDIWDVQDALQRFEAVLAAEFGTMHIYIVSKKGGLDINDLIWNGEACFPSDLLRKAPEAIGDVREAARCIAFELPTAAAFHLHRANEAVLRRYFEAVGNGAAHPRSGNMGDYINALSNGDLGTAAVRAALRDLKNLHRNPIAHPEHSVESVDEAIDLMGAVRSAIGSMLREMPVATGPLAVVKMAEASALTQPGTGGVARVQTAPARTSSKKQRAKKSTKRG